MMTKVTQFLRQYPWVVAATVVGILGVVANLAVGEQVARWLVTGFAAVVALHQGAQMVRSLLNKQWGLGVLALTAIVSTLLVGALRAIRETNPRPKQRAVDSMSVQRARV